MDKTGWRVRKHVCFNMGCAQIFWMTYNLLPFAYNFFNFSEDALQEGHSPLSADFDIVEAGPSTSSVSTTSPNDSIFGMAQSLGHTSLNNNYLLLIGQEDKLRKIKTALEIFGGRLSRASLVNKRPTNNEIHQHNTNNNQVGDFDNNFSFETDLNDAHDVLCSINAVILDECKENDLTDFFIPVSIDEFTTEDSSDYQNIFKNDGIQDSLDLFSSDDSILDQWTNLLTDSDNAITMEEEEISGEENLINQRDSQILSTTTSTDFLQIGCLTSTAGQKDGSMGNKRIPFKPNFLRHHSKQMKPHDQNNNVEINASSSNEGTSYCLSEDNRNSMRVRQKRNCTNKKFKQCFMTSGTNNQKVIIRYEMKVNENEEGFTKNDCNEEMKVVDVALSQILVGRRLLLWRFLLYLLINSHYYGDIITWRGYNGEFVLLEPECVAKLWGNVKCKENMTYTCMSRTLRHYYKQKILSKVRRHGCYEYKFNFENRIIMNYWNTIRKSKYH